MRHPVDDPWQVAPDAMARGATAAQRLGVLATWATLAPSSHNTQPWLFRVAGTTLELLADRSRALPVVDPHDRELTISCGAALGILRLAAEALGERIEVTVSPSQEVLARVAHRGLGVPGDAAILDAIRARRTTRTAFAAEPVPVALMLEADAEAAAAGATLRWMVSDADRHGLAELVAEGDRAQLADAAFRAELADWMHSRRAASRDGLSAGAFGMPDMMSAVSAMVIRRFDMGEGQAARDRALAEGSPALAAVTTPADTPSDWLAAGDALARVLVRLGRAGFTASYLNQPVEVPALRARLAEALGTHEAPQLLLRVGRGPALPPSVRRPVGQVLRMAPADAA